MDVDAVKNFINNEMMDESILYTKAADFIIANATALPEPEAPAEAPAAEAPAEAE